MKPWFERSFPFDSPAWLLPNLVERLRGTPARLEDALAGVPSAVLTRRDGARWSAQEHVGHLLELEPLWTGRVDDLLAGAPALRDADLSNSGTDAARYNEAELSGILRDFRHARRALIDRVGGGGPGVAERAALHPRLKQPMRLVDLAYFVAEHDDHHLARIHQLLRQFGGA